MGIEGKRGRDDRLLHEHSGSWGSSSTDFVVLIWDLYRLSKEYADRIDGNCSRFTYCGIPMLLSALRCLMIEYESSYPVDNDALKIPSKPGDFLRMVKHYEAPPALLQEAEDLCEIRNEIIHPAHLPTGTADNWPDYLRHLKEKGLLQSSGTPEVDYIFFDQIASHRLFAWACRVCRDIAQLIVHSNADKKEPFSHFADAYDSIEFADDLEVKHGA